MHLEFMLIVIACLQWQSIVQAQGGSCTNILETMCKSYFWCPDVKEGCGKQRNLAFRKPTKQSSMYKEFGIYKMSHMWSRNAVDGNWNPDFYIGGSCMHTIKEQGPWLDIDLERNYPIDEVVVANRGETSIDSRDRNVGRRLCNMDVKVKAQDGRWQTFGRRYVGPAKDGEVIRVKHSKPMVGRHVRIQLAANTYLHVCEVEVLGKAC